MQKLLKTPKTYSYDGAALEEHAKKISENTELLENLRKKADEILGSGNLSVVNRKIKAASGNPHDYASMGPYWWPDPAKKDGLPYIRHDGQVNPETKESQNFGALFSRVTNLTAAAYYFAEKKYADKAVEILKAWYLDEETYMTPNLRYGQMIPGICDGRGIGLIDCASSYQIFDSVELLDAMGFMPEDVKNGLKEWYGKFLDWMLTSETGVDEDRQHNNHGAWYDVQVASTALFLDRPILANRTLALAYERRTLKHIQSDGKQPFELARTNGLGYSLMNLRALMILAELSPKAKCKVDVWKAEGTPLKAAIDYLRQYFDSLDGFEYQQISGKIDRSGASHLLMYAEKHYPGNGYAEQAEKYMDATMLWRVLPV